MLLALPSLLFAAAIGGAPAPHLSATLPVDGPGETCVLYLAEKYPDAWEEARARNVPVLILDFDGWEDTEATISSFFEDRDFLQAADRAVVVISSQHRHDEMVQIVRGEERKVCSVFGCVPPATHQRMKQAVFADFQEQGTLITPLFLVADADKEVLERLTQEQSRSSITEALERGQRRLDRSGPSKGLGRVEYDGLLEARLRIADAIERRDWRLAARTEESISKVEGKLPIHQSLREVRDALSKAGQAQLQDIEARWEAGEHRAALFTMDELGFGFGRHPVGKKAASAVKSWLKDEKGKPYAAELKEEGKARELYHDARDLEAAADFRRALSTLRRLMKKYPETLWAEKAISLARICERELEGG